MIRTYEAVTDQSGILRLLTPEILPAQRRAFVTILDEEAEPSALESAMMSEASLAVEWDTPEEDKAWSHLAQLPSL
jgi:hypothetical protein